MSASLTEISQAVSKVIAAAAPSVVGIGRSGSGVVVADGLVVTNAHNLREDVAVTFADGRTAPATVAGADIDGDLAVLAVDTAGAPALEWSSRNGTLGLGELVLGLSRPGGRGVRAGVGFVSGTGLAFRGPEGRPINGALEHSAPLPSGSSGGPLLDSDGRLVGVNTHRPGDGTYLAQPAGPELKARVDALAKGQVPQRARLGVALSPAKVARRLRQAVGLPERDGALVHEVDQSGPGAQGGLRRGDLIVSLDGNAIASPDELATALARAGGASSVSLVVVRGSDEVLLTVSFGPAGGPGAEEGTA